MRGISCRKMLSKFHALKSVRKEVVIEAFIIMALATTGMYEGIRLLKQVLVFKDYIGPGGYIFIVSGLLFICGFLYLLSHIMHTRPEIIANKKPFSLQIGTVGRLSIIFVLYAIATPLLGYFLAVYSSLCLRYGLLECVPGSGVSSLVWRFL